MKFSKEQLLVYAITDRKYSPLPLAEQVRAALSGGATIVQLREKTLSKAEFLAEAIEIKKICMEFGVPMLIDDDVGLALKCGADGVHVGRGDTPVWKIRKIAPENFIVGATAKTVEEAKTAEQEGADYLGVGAVFPSPTKPNAVPVTKEELFAIASFVRIPTVAIGGITYSNMEELQGSGVSGFAFVSEIFAQSDIAASARRLLQRAKAIVK